MTTVSRSQPGTVLDALVDAIESSAEYNAGDVVKPAVILWPDPEEEWKPLIGRLRDTIPNLLTLGEFKPEQRIGPAIWIRCMVAGKLPEAKWDEDDVPVIYLPGVAETDLQPNDKCPDALKPLAELQYRGTWFREAGLQEWTVYRFLTLPDVGLGANIEDDGQTRAAIHRSLERLTDVSIRELQQKPWHADDFNKLLHPDPIRGVLQWLNDPDGTRASWPEKKWAAFREACEEEFGWDPDKEGALEGAERLAERSGNWKRVWDRFAQAPRTYPNVVKLLQQAGPTERPGPDGYVEVWPQHNAWAEEDLRKALVTVGDLPLHEAIDQVEELDTVHGVRREWVWARLDDAPLAEALDHLARLAKTVTNNLPAGSAEELQDAYLEWGWEADLAMMDALATVRKFSDIKAVRLAIRALYQPWLEVGAERLQQIMKEGHDPDYLARCKELKEVQDGTCILFADGLRSDLAHRLMRRLEDALCEVTSTPHWVPLPSTTPTAKPLASPVGDSFEGIGTDGSKFRPRLKETKQDYNIDRFRKLLEEAGFEVLATDETGDPSTRAWTEHGEIDSRGHNEQWKLVRRIDEEIAGLVDRVQTLFDHGWKEIRIVTDHGWLLLPGGLPKIDLPHYLVKDRWTRCAAVKPGSKVEVPIAPWYWNPDVTVATPSGIKCFPWGKEYSHGGISPQECIVLDLTVTLPGSSSTDARITSLKWLGLRCRIETEGTGSRWSVDVRTRAADPESSLAADQDPAAVEEGKASILVEDPDAEGMAATIVLLDDSGTPVAKKNTTVGGGL